jgi:hypothetical protein
MSLDWFLTGYRLYNIGIIAKSVLAVLSTHFFMTYACLRVLAGFLGRPQSCQVLKSN